jgi:serine/threonine protein kinase
MVQVRGVGVKRGVQEGTPEDEWVVTLHLARRRRLALLTPPQPHLLILVAHPVVLPLPLPTHPRVKGSLFEPDICVILTTAAEVASALAYLHSRGILHGDLTGNNVLLTKSAGDRRGWTAKVGAVWEGAAGGDGGAQDCSRVVVWFLIMHALHPDHCLQFLSCALPSSFWPVCPTTPSSQVSDFGLARQLSTEAPVIQTRSYGTVTHMPPELLMKGVMSMAVDVYSWGVVAWEMFMGHRPYSGMSHSQVRGFCRGGGQGLLEEGVALLGPNVIALPQSEQTS